MSWGICTLIISLAVLPVYFLLTSPNTQLVNEGETWFSDLVALTESCTNEIALIGATIFFLLTIERRYKRERALKAMHELRSFAHVIDMHQLTKDPHRIVNPTAYTPTEGSPKMELTPFQLRRYLDYCIEMLSLAGKIGAVYVQEFEDSDAMAAAAEVEELTTGLSQKIWQKISLLPTIKQKENVAATTPLIDPERSDAQQDDESA